MRVLKRATPSLPARGHKRRSSNNCRAPAKRVTFGGSICPPCRRKPFIESLAAARGLVQPTDGTPLSQVLVCCRRPQNKIGPSDDGNDEGTSASNPAGDSHEPAERV